MVPSGHFYPNRLGHLYKEHRDQYKTKVIKPCDKINTMCYDYPFVINVPWEFLNIKLTLI